MRLYTREEAEELVKNFNKKYEDISADGFYMKSPLTVEDLLVTKTIKFSEYLEKYKLNYGDDTYEYYKNLVDDNLGVSDEITELNTYGNVSEDEYRYPIIILGNNNSKGDDVPDLYNFTELTYLMKHYEDKDMRIILLDKMKKPFSKDILDLVADFYGVEEYDYSVYA